MAAAPIQTTTVPGGTLTYSGNPDFRGYLAAQDIKGNNLAGDALAYVGNDGGVNPSISMYGFDTPGKSVGQLTNFINQQYAAYNNLTNPAAAGSSSSSGNNYGPADSAIQGQARTSLQTALDALNASNAAVAASEGQQENELNSNEAAQQNTYGNTRTKNAQDFTGAETAARTQGNSDLTSLDRLIGSMGGGGSSVETEEVPALVGRSVAGNIAGAATTKAQNDQAADVAWNTFLNQLASQRQQLHDQASQQQATNQGAYNRTAQILNTIINAAKGGAISPSDLNYELESATAQIPNVVNWTPSFSGTTPVYQTPALSNFSLTPSQIAAASGVALPTSGASTIPFAGSLTKQQQLAMA